MDKCYICEREGETLYPLQSCRHVFCRVCIVNVLGNTISALQKGEHQNFFGVSCPVQDCSGFLSRQDVRGIAGFSAVNYLDNQLIITKNWDMGLDDMSYRIQVLQQAFEDFIASNHKDIQAEIDTDVHRVQFVDPTPKYFCFFRKKKKDGSKKIKDIDAKPSNSSVLARVLQEFTQVFVTLNSSSYACTFFLCVHSPLRNVLYKFMENDSILEISNHPYVYDEVFNLLEGFSTRAELFPLLCSVDDTSDFWLHKEFQKGSVMGSFQKLYNQAHFIVNSKQLQTDELVSRCKHVFEKLDCSMRNWKSEVASHPWFVDADEFFNERFPGVILMHALVQGGTVEIVEDTKAVYLQTLKSMQFDQAKLDNHYFRKHGFVNDNTQTRRISKEIAALADSLPIEYTSSVHIRFDEDRMDLLRALIIGPHDTPYENGIFMFDIFLGENYPQNPPRLQFLTTGGGTVRFNPNLYENGMVCLSIINTWSGPQWKPGNSTVLQMLCSLQGLVFVSEPYYNEPEADSEMLHQSASANYNQMQRYNTLMHSILPALKQPDVAFAKLIQSHFRLKRSYIEEQCDRWLVEGLEYGKETRSAVEMVKMELTEKFGPSY